MVSVREPILSKAHACMQCVACGHKLSKEERKQRIAAEEAAAEEDIETLEELDEQLVAPGLLHATHHEVLYALCTYHTHLA